MTTTIGGMESFIGKSIAGYRLATLLGTGLMGGVFLGYRLDKPDEMAAIKILVPSVQASEPERVQLRRRFQREADILQAFHHQSIVPILGYGLDEGTLYLIMPYMSGGTLKQRMSVGLLNQDATIKMLSVVGMALEAAHLQGIVHRDLKPENILFDMDGKAYLADFSIAHVEESRGERITTSGMLLGTPAFMSPEQIRGETLDGRSDQFSLGVIAYAALTGHIPFTGATSFEVMTQVIQQTPQDIRQFQSDIPPGIAKSIARALEKDPTQRFGSIKDFVAALSSFSLESLPLAVQSVTEASPHFPTLLANHREIPSRQRRPGRVLLGAAIILLVSVVMSFIVLLRPNIFVHDAQSPASAGMGRPVLRITTPLPPTSTPLPPTPSPLNVVDWNNFTYPNMCAPEPQTIMTVNGVAQFDGRHFEVLEVSYGHLTNPESMEAAVLYMCVGADTGPYGVMIYSGLANHPVLLGNLPGTVDNPTQVLQMRSISQVSISYQQILLTGPGFSSSLVAYCCPDVLLTNIYRWDGQQFILTEQTHSPLQ